jgi:hypothetical protein
MTVLSTCWVVALNGALGVAVAVGGLRVRVGGTSEKGVLVKKGVNVGRGVLLGVRTSVGLAVQVGSSRIGVGVRVGILLDAGGRKLKEDWGLRKIQMKYPARQTAMINTSMASMSQSSMVLPRDCDRVPSKSNSSLI